MRFEWKDTLTDKVGGSVHTHAGWVYLGVVTADGTNNACYTDPATGRQIAAAILAACDEIDPPVPHTVALRFAGSPDVAIETTLRGSAELSELAQAICDAAFRAGVAYAMRGQNSPAAVDPIRIERWLTPQDIEAHGDRWRWWSPDGEEVWIEPCTAVVSGATVRLRLDSDTRDRTRPWKSGSFAPGDYFTPIQPAKRSSG